MRSRPSWIKFKDLGLRHQTLHHQPLPTHPAAPLPVLHPLQTHQTPKFSRLITPYYFFQIHFLIHLGNLSRSMCIGLYSFLSFSVSFSSLSHTHTNHLHRIQCVLCSFDLDSQFTYIEAHVIFKNQVKNG